MRGQKVLYLEEGYLVYPSLCEAGAMTLQFVDAIRRVP